MSAKRKAIFLDRDGVVSAFMPYGKYLTDMKDLKLNPGVTDFVRAAKKKGYLAVLVTNQPQVAKGLLAKEELHAIHEKVQTELGEKLDAIYACVHQDSDNCECRKPKPGMLLRASRELNIDLAHSYFVGDTHKDVGAGKGAGVKTVLLRHSENEKELMQCTPDFVVENIGEVAKLI